MTPNTFSVQFIIKQDKQDNGGLVPVYAKVFINGSKIELSTFRKINPNHWDKAKKQIKPTVKNATEVNQFLEDFKSRIYACYSKLIASSNELSAEGFKNQFYGKKEKKNTPQIIEAAQKHNQNFESLIGIKYSYGSYKNYKTTLKYLQEFVPETFNKKDVPLTEINFKFCEAFFHFLTTKKNCQTNGANKQLQRVKKIVNYAIKQGYINYNPMATYTLEFKPVNKIALTLDEVRRISNLKLNRKTLETVKDIFLFQCYTGISYSDAKRLSSINISKDRKEQKWVKMTRAKTQTLFSVPLLPQANEILEKYLKESIENNAILPVLSNQKMNDNLKVIQELAAISKNLTTHLARHTFATTITLNNGVPIETVSRMLGHTKLSTTQMYAKVLDDKIAKDMDALKEKLK